MREIEGQSKKEYVRVPVRVVLLVRVPVRSLEFNIIKGMSQSDRVSRRVDGI
jgi:hypothetical protein